MTFTIQLQQSAVYRTLLTNNEFFSIYAEAMWWVQTITGAGELSNVNIEMGALRVLWIFIRHRRNHHHHLLLLHLLVLITSANVNECNAYLQMLLLWVIQRVMCTRNSFCSCSSVAIVNHYDLQCRPITTQLTRFRPATATLNAVGLRSREFS